MGAKMRCAQGGGVDGDYGAVILFCTNNIYEARFRGLCCFSALPVVNHYDNPNLIYKLRQCHPIYSHCGQQR